MRRFKVLLSAYACEPDQGSEPGVGWHVAQAMAAYHDVWVLTRANNRSSITRALNSTRIPRLRFVYYDLPRWARWWKRGGRGRQLYYYLWQVGAYFVARALHQKIGFDLIHHVTIGKYWAPSFLSLLRVPFIWGPVGGAESAPRVFWRGLGLRGQCYTLLRSVARWFGEHDPFVRFTARMSALTLAKTEETAERIRKLGGRNVRVFPEAALQIGEIGTLAHYSISDGRPFRFISIGRLCDFKGFHLGLYAFAQSNLADAEYWIVGDGPERGRLAASAQALGIGNRVRFWGRLSREETLRKLGQAHVLVHPSLHDSGGWVCVEAMAAGRPVICLDLGGPAVQVTGEVGFKIQADDPKRTLRSLAEAMRRLAGDPSLRRAMAEAGRRRSRQTFCWEHKRTLLDAMYADVMRGLRGSALAGT